MALNNSSLLDLGCAQARDAARDSCCAQRGSNGVPGAHKKPWPDEKSTRSKPWPEKIAGTPVASPALSEVSQGPDKDMMLQVNVEAMVYESVRELCEKFEEVLEERWEAKFQEVRAEIDKLKFFHGDETVGYTVQDLVERLGTFENGMKEVKEKTDKVEETVRKQRDVSEQQVDATGARINRLEVMLKAFRGKDLSKYITLVSMTSQKARLSPMRLSEMRR